MKKYKPELEAAQKKMEEAQGKLKSKPELAMILLPGLLEVAAAAAEVQKNLAEEGKK